MTVYESEQQTIVTHKEDEESVNTQLPAPPPETTVNNWETPPVDTRLDEWKVVKRKKGKKSRK